MSTALIALSQTAVKARQELNLIAANAKTLKPAGFELMPLKPDMLALPDTECAMVMEAVGLLFASSMRYVAAQLREHSARDVVDHVEARLDKGTAEATCAALLHSSTVALIALACERAPIAMHAILQVCPELDLKDRLLAITRPRTPYVKPMRNITNARSHYLKTGRRLTPKNTRK